MNVHLLSTLNRWSRRSIILLVAALFIVIGLVDSLTGVEITISIFYLLPIAMAAWFLGRAAGLMTAVIATMIWLLADIYGGHAYAYNTIPYWNSAVRFGSFLIVSLSLSTLRASQI